MQAVSVEVAVSYACGGSGGADDCDCDCDGDGDGGGGKEELVHREEREDIYDSAGAVARATLDLICTFRGETASSAAVPVECAGISGAKVLEIP
jgi:hypothetical protein